MKQIRLVVTDLDKTLLRSDKTISDYSIGVLRKCKASGILVAFATARFEIGAKRFIQAVGPNFEITTDGALTRANRELVRKIGMSIDTSNRLIAALICNRSVKDVIVATENGCFWNSQEISESLDLHEAEYNDYQAPPNVETYKILARIESYDVASEISRSFPECKLTRYSGEGIYSFVQKDVSKFAAMSRLLELLHIDIQNVVAFGDDLNDKEMIEKCGVGVAVKNAVSDVIDIADFVSDSNDDDVVARFIERNLL